MHSADLTLLFRHTRRERSCRMTFRLLLRLSLTVLVFGMTLTPVPTQNLGDTTVLAGVPLPGFPEGIATKGNRFYVSGPAAFGLPLGSAYVQAYDIRTGVSTATFPIT